MKKTKVRLDAVRGICVTLLMGMILTGCQETQIPEDSKTQGGVTSGSTEKKEENAGEQKNKPYEGTTIHVLTVPQEATELADKYIPEFEEATGIKVEIEYLERSALNTKQEMELGMKSGAYDVMHMDPSKAVRYERADWVEPLDDLIANSDPDVTDQNLDINDFVPGYLNLQKANGKILGLPFSGEAAILYYRTDLFEQAGIKEPPRNFTELEEAARKINELGVPGIGLRAKAGNGVNMAIWPAFLYGAGGSLVDDKGYPSLDTPEAIQAAAKYAELIQKYGPVGGGDFAHYELYTAFQQGNLGMFYDASTMSKNFIDKEKSKVTETWAAAPGPLGDNGEGANLTFSHGMMIPKGCENKEAAWQFIQWYTGKDLQKKISTDATSGFGAITRESVMELPEYVDIHGKHGWSVAVEGSLEHTRDDYWMYNNPDWSWIGDTIGKGLQDIIIGNGTAEENLKRVNDDVISFMKEKNYIQ